MTDDFCACPAHNGDNNPSAYSVSWRKARKGHVCCECGAKILPGNRYEYTWGVWEEGPEVYKTCETCAQVRSGIFCDGWTYTQMWQDLYEFLRDCHPDAPWSKIRDLPEPAQGKVLKIVNEIVKEELEEESP